MGIIQSTTGCCEFRVSFFCCYFCIRCPIMKVNNSSSSSKILLAVFLVAALMVSCTIGMVRRCGGEMSMCGETVGYDCCPGYTCTESGFPDVKICEQLLLETRHN